MWHFNQQLEKTRPKALDFLPFSVWCFVSGWFKQEQDRHPVAKTPASSSDGRNTAQGLYCIKKSSAFISVDINTFQGWKTKALILKSAAF